MRTKIKQKRCKPQSWISEASLRLDMDVWNMWKTAIFIQYKDFTNVSIP